jgi:6-phosphogluconolactonase
VHVSPDGAFLYGSNRGHDSIVIYRIEPDSGRLSYVGHQASGGRTPRNFAIEPGGRFLLAANQDSDSIATFRIDPSTGSLEPTGKVVEVPTPVCVKVQAF